MNMGHELQLNNNTQQTRKSYTNLPGLLAADYINQYKITR